MRQGLAARYGHPVTALNLVKAAEKRPRESILRTEFAAAVRYLNCTVRGGALAAPRAPQAAAARAPTRCAPHPSIACRSHGAAPADPNP
jgi:hypothetical protein